MQDAEPERLWRPARWLAVPTARYMPLPIALPDRALLLIAGMPGAGKTTLLQRLSVSRDSPSDSVVVLDSDAIRATLARRWPMVPYRRYRPLVHLLHRLVIGRAALGAVPVLVVHLPATGAATRTALAGLARLTGREAHVVWLDADPTQARAGQLARGRVVSAGSFARHSCRAVAVTRRLRQGERLLGWRSATLLDGTAARRGIMLMPSSLPPREW
ncbi:MAG: AAA family ATPase [Pseudonocardiaceae bacterium]